MIALTEDHVRLLRSIIRSTQTCIEEKKGYSFCYLKDVEDIYNVDVLSLARHITSTTYLMANCHAENELFVHYTTEEAFASILSNGFDLSKKTLESDYLNALCCFRVDAMSRGFNTNTVYIPILFRYTGWYLTCIRQDDVNSNIGYQVIEDLSGISDIKMMQPEEFEFQKDNEELNYKSILLHHGLPPEYENKIKGTRYAYLSDMLPRLFKLVTEGPKATVDITNVF